MADQGEHEDREPSADARAIFAALGDLHAMAGELPDEADPADPHRPRGDITRALVDALEARLANGADHGVDEITATLVTSDAGVLGAIDDVAAARDFLRMLLSVDLPPVQ